MAAWDSAQMLTPVTPLSSSCRRRRNSRIIRTGVRLRSRALVESSRSMSSQNAAISSLANGYRHTIGGSTAVISRLRFRASKSANTVSVELRFRRVYVEASTIRCRPTKSSLRSSMREPPDAATRANAMPSCRRARVIRSLQPPSEARMRVRNPRDRRVRADGRRTIGARGMATAQVGDITITNADKIWWPDDGVTKGDVAHHYARVASRLLPFSIDRPLTVERCPDGLRGKCFFQKNFASAEKLGVPTVAIRAASVKRMVHYPLGNDLRTLLALVNLGALSLHLTSCRAGSLDRADWLAFDLDPATRFTDAVQAALVLREVLDEVGLRGYPKTTGGKGLHVLIPLRPGFRHADVLACAVRPLDRPCHHGCMAPGMAHWLSWTPRNYSKSFASTATAARRACAGAGSSSAPSRSWRLVLAGGWRFPRSPPRPAARPPRAGRAAAR